MRPNTAFSFSTLLAIVFSLNAFGQELPPKKKLPATKTEAKFKIDGVLDEADWQKAPDASNFVMFEPENGPQAPAAFKTVIKVLYSDAGIYLGATMYDPNPDSILTQITQRDEYNQNCDWLGFFINPYNDGLSDFNFWVTAAGTQADGRTTANGDDFTLNSIWQSNVSIHDSGWTMEAFVPYIALRFPKTQVSDWGLNFMRNIRRYRWNYTWNLLDRSSGYRLEYQSGLLTEMANIDPPVRLSLIPYGSVYAENYQGINQVDANAGLDLKYGLNESFTLDATLIPDFGQVAFDPQVLNLSAFENRFDENRQFFTEGTELFTIGDLLYTRRIGGAPKNITGNDLNSNDSVDIRLEFTRLINATKLSGRTKNNLGVGVLNAVTDANFSTKTVNGKSEQVLTEPMTNYNVIVLDQRFNRNSSVSLVNTNVMRQGGALDANVTALATSIFNKKGTMRYDATAATSNKFSTTGIESGYRANAVATDVAGNLIWELTTNYMDNDYDINDLGFQQRNNQWSTSAYIGHRLIQPKGKFNRRRFGLGVERTTLVKPHRFEDFAIRGDAFWLLRSFFAYGLDFTYRPVETYDYFEPREFGRWFKYPSAQYLSGFISSDYRKTVAVDARSYIDRWDERNYIGYGYSVDLRLRFGDHFFAILSNSIEWQDNNYGYVPDNDPDLIYFGRRDNQNITNSVNATYSFNPKLSLTASARHLNAMVDYASFYLLENNGDLTAAQLDGVSDLNFNTYNLDMRLSWWFAPASEMVVLYRQAIADATNNAEASYLNNINNTLLSPQQNSISLRISYFLDYYLTKKAIQSRKKA